MRSRLLLPVLAGGAFSTLLLGSALAADWMPTSQPAAVAPAVSGVNGKIAAAFGAVNDEGAATLSGSFVTPLGHSFGLQLDGSVGSTDGNASYGIGAHAFWRDPSQALLGVYASYSGFDGERDVNLGLVAAEGEAYFGRVSLEGLVGFDYGYGDTDLFGSATVGFYPLDDLRLYGGYLNVVGRSFATLGAEWQPGLAAAPNASLFADGLVGEDDAWSVMGGVRFYLGKEHKSLIRRHREDDPGDLGLRAVSQVLDHLQVKAEEVRCPKPKVMLNGSCVYLSHN